VRQFGTETERQNPPIAVSLASVMMVSATESKIVSDALSSADWIAKALSSSGYRANFSLKSLKEIDRFFDEQAPEGNPKPGGLLSQGLGARIFALGAYVGEVIRRRAKGEWLGDDGDPDAEINLALRLRGGEVILPVQRVMKRFKNGANDVLKDGLYAYGFAIAPPRFYRFGILRWLWLHSAVL
jgi:hypothetical protein